MITLFRRIRQKLIESGSITKYLLYAIGEILLVVIGILIALQVNNWNEERLQRQKEQVYLRELKKDFEEILNRSEQGMELYNENINVMMHLREAVQTFQNLNGNTSTFPFDLDSLAMNLETFASGRVPAGPAPFYSEMKASGLLVILQNQDLSRQLAVYDNAARVGSEGFRTLRDQLMPALHHALSFSNFTYDLEEDVNNYSMVTAEADIAAFMSDPESLGAISIAISVFGNMYMLHQSQGNTAKDVLKLLDQVLIETGP